ncbi:probable l-isoaspartyl protein carboxyl methyltransferase [Ustilago trichophora]|uniref:Protein-L-isoaspartate O-methyltransferase n=1 Tax=Ustilago trichophora TaxID=86804 RepID=A0A5C3E0I4_9BASI|nr:probable l-isoaspartyl protein carboxyl methyltransferase [Ustilago trichophora]
MAWRCSGSTNAELINNMVNSSLITSSRVASAMTAVDRALYVLHPHHAYQDSPQSIGYGATISAPHIHAHAAENLLPFLHPGAKVLDVGSGSGYTLAIFHHLVSPSSLTDSKKKGKVIGIDHIQALVELANQNLKKDGLIEESKNKKTKAKMENEKEDDDEEEGGRIVNICGDGRKGVESEAPFDAIHVGAAAKNIPRNLVDQLKSPGRMFIPVEDGDSGEQNIWQVDKTPDGTVTKQKLGGVLYVPLTDVEKQWRS